MIMGQGVGGTPSVAVLMSTYNGARFLREQVESVLAQEGVGVTLFVRDDGSTDGTMDVLKEFGDAAHVIRGGNVGVGPSFMRLVSTTMTSYDYFSFCDQDDVWLLDKLAVAVSALGSASTPRLYCSNQALADADGNRMETRHDCAPDLSWMQTLCSNQATGCTMVWNQALQTILSSPARIPSDELLRNRIHDVWVAMVAALVGEIAYDEEPHILYRQHDSNVVGARGESIVRGWLRKLRDPSLRNGRSLLAAEVIRCLGDVAVDQSAVRKLAAYASYRSDREARNLLFSDVPKLAEHSGERAVALKLKVALGLF